MIARRTLFALAALLSVVALGWYSMPVGGVAGYAAKRSDNVCGLRNIKQVENPARVDYPTLEDATPEWRRIRKEGIDPDSARGLALRAEADRRVLDACEKVRQDKGYDSLWRAIRRLDGGPVADVTDAVLARMRRHEEPIPAPGAP